MKRLINTFCLVMVIITASAGGAWAAEVKLYLTRHGKTMFNTAHRAQGWADTPLTESGAAVAAQLGRGLQPVTFVAAWSSDAGRARETAQLAMKTWTRVPVLRDDPRLREVCFGLYEGDLDKNMLTAAALKAGYPSDTALLEAFSTGTIQIKGIIDAIHQAEASGTAALPGVKSSGQAETYQQVASRMLESLTAIARQAQQQGGGNVLVVSHGMAITALLQALGDTSLRGQLSNASVTLLRYTEKGTFVIEAINDMRYVERGL